MKKIIIILLSVILAFTVSSISLAVEKEEELKVSVPPELSKLPTAAKVQQITGEVKAINISAQSILVTKKIRDKVVEAVIKVNDTTKIQKEKEQKTLSDIKVGDKVVVRYTKVDGKNIAKNIAIQPARPQSEKK
ncbi:MAG: hypothetical protein QMC83_02805 [Thermodesulfovibrionales bacterium]|nr:hypothetical protein [Thermodesulfovibrionales bacterium]